MRLVLLALALPAVLGLAGCGKKGPPSPPGPQDQIIYPKAYPNPTPPRPAS
jgi:predicted small lipoprotein YifL